MIREGNSGRETLGRSLPWEEAHIYLCVEMGYIKMLSENGVIRMGSNLIQILFPTLKMMDDQGPRYP